MGEIYWFRNFGQPWKYVKLEVFVVNNRSGRQTADIDKCYLC